MLKNTISLLNAIPLLNTVFVVLEHSLKHQLVLAGLVGIPTVIVGVRYRNYLKMKRKHIGQLVNILNRWEGVTCEMPRIYTLNNEFISLGEFKSIQRYRDYVFARDHLKSYPCYEVWEHTMKLISSLNKTAKELCIELNKTIVYRLNRKVFSSDIYIPPVHNILDFVVKALIADLDKNQGGNGYLHVDVQEKWVVGEVGGIFILAEGGSIEDLEACRSIIGDIISSKYYQGKIRGLHFQFENTVKINIKEFKKQLREIATIAKHTKELKGKCKGCPRF